MPKPHVSLRVNISLELYEKISTYRYEARHETRAQALVALLAAGLAALSKPPGLPPPARSGGLIPYAGKPAVNGKRQQWRADREEEQCTKTSSGT